MILINGKAQPNDRTRDVMALRRCRTLARQSAHAGNVSESGASDAVIMSIAGHVSRAALSRYQGRGVRHRNTDRS